VTSCTAQFRIPAESRLFPSPKRPDRLWDTPSILYNGYGGCLPGVKRQGREAEHSSVCNAMVKNGGAIPPKPHVSSLRERNVCTRDGGGVMRNFMIGAARH
jgi:hypothetical protein